MNRTPRRSTLTWRTFRLALVALLLSGVHAYAGPKTSKAMPRRTSVSSSSASAGVATFRNAKGSSASRVTTVTNNKARISKPGSVSGRVSAASAPRSRSVVRTATASPAVKKTAPAIVPSDPRVRAALAVPARREAPKRNAFSMATVAATPLVPVIPPTLPE